MAAWTRLRAVLFDLDDTLLDHAPCRRNAWEALRRAFPGFARVPVETLIREQESLFREHQPRVLRGEWTPEESVRESLRCLGERYALQWQDAELDRVWQAFSLAYESQWFPVAGAGALLHALAGRVAVGVVTNGLYAPQKAKLAAAGLAPYVQFLMTPDVAGAAKPEAEIYQAALQCADATPASAVFAGDLWETDMVGAHAAGLRALWFNPTRQPHPQPAWAHEIQAYVPLEPVLQWLFNPASVPG
jgi:putative hydrolase of the HAD superfamily